MDIAGGFAAAQYVGGIEEADGIRFPARRRAYLRRPDGRPDPDHVMVGIDLSDVHYA
ncbi:hypothetical protein [Streptomyces sp. NPDC051016]|uniref:hypothetical protein n=1 Tax=Streptomyces sp. NPDC051016 TaxID=3365638 RepID=UPI0037AEAD7E